MNGTVSSSFKITLALAVSFFLYKLFTKKKKIRDTITPQPLKSLKFKKKDMQVHELRQFDGTQSDGRVLVAVNGKIFDVTKGKRFYGPGGPYANFGGHDASRGLALFRFDLVKEVYDDLSDLDSKQMESVRKWEEQFNEKYDFVGRLLKPGEEPTICSDEEEGERS